MNENALTIQEQPLSVGELLTHVNTVQQVMKHVMKDGEHFGKVPGCGDKPTLLQPGAQKLMLTFRMTPDYKMEVIDLPREHREYRVICNLLNSSGHFIGAGNGSASTMESKYRFRKGELKCPECDKPSIIKGKAEFGGGWICYAKKGGCGAKWSDDDNPFHGVSTDRVEHDNPADYYNCVVPETRVLTHDLQWVEAGDVESGDMLIGVEENMSNQYARHFAIGEATVHGRKADSLYEITFSDGRAVRCNGEHNWLVKKIGNGTEWVKTLDIYAEGRKATGRPRKWSVMSVCAPWTEDTSKEAGYIAGLLDADGSLGTTQLIVLFAQQLNSVLARLQRGLIERGYKLGVSPCRTPAVLEQSVSQKQVHSVRVLGGFAEQLRLLGTIRPQRLLERWLTLVDITQRRLEGRGSGAGSPVEIASIIQIGEGEVVMLGTTCHTYIAEGLVCHNTCLKMACKRALVSAVLTRTAASDIFTQDLDEIAENLKAAAVNEPPRTEKPKEAPRKTETPANIIVSNCMLLDFKEAASKPDAPKPWRAWFCKFDDGNVEFEAGTFDAKIAANLDVLKGAEVALAYKPGKKAGTFEIVSIEPRDDVPM